MSTPPLANAPPPRFYLKCLGDLALSTDMGLVGAARRKPLAVLAYLAAEAPGEVNREVLAQVLWPESSPDRARHTLTQTLYALRRECGVDLIAGTTRLMLDPAMVRTDVAAFLSAVRRNDVDAALAAYTGPFLEGFAFVDGKAFEDWSERHRSRLMRAHREVLLAAVDRAMTAGDDHAALRYLSEAHTWYPDDVRITERLAMQYLVTDAAHLAVRVIDLLERRLREESQVPLPESLKHLRERLLAGDPAASDIRVAGALPSPSTSAALDNTGASEGTTLGAGYTTSKEDRRPSGHGNRSRWWTRRVALWGGLTAAAAALAFLVKPVVRQPLAEPEPQTLGELSQATLERQWEARLALIDSTHVGSIVLLPSRTAREDQPLDSMLLRLDRQQRRQLARDDRSSVPRYFRETTFTTFIPADTVNAIMAEIANGRAPTTTTLQMAELLRRTGSALAVQPLLSRHGDTLRVRYLYHRDISHTSAAKPGVPNIETLASPRQWVVGTKWPQVVWESSGRLLQFVRQLESCDASFHATVDAAPWCWTEGKRLRVALTPEQVRVLQEREIERARARERSAAATVAP